jgi:hypothetical protein
MNSPYSFGKSISIDDANIEFFFLCTNCSKVFVPEEVYTIMAVVRDQLGSGKQMIGNILVAYQKMTRKQLLLIVTNVLLK